MQNMLKKMYNFFFMEINAESIILAASALINLAALLFWLLL
jgi:hypothetical protein